LTTVQIHEHVSRKATTSAWLLSEHMNFQTHFALGEVGLPFWYVNLRPSNMTATSLFHTSASVGDESLASDKCRYHRTAASTLLRDASVCVTNGVRNTNEFPALRRNGPVFLRPNHQYADARI
jgi:hypothetical protein